VTPPGRSAPGPPAPVPPLAGAPADGTQPAASDRDAPASPEASRRVRVGDLLCVGSGAGLGGLFILGMVTETPPDPVHVWWEVFGGGSAVVLLLFLRRRRPVTTALLLLPLAFTSALGLGLSFTSVFTVAAHRAWRAALAVGALYMVTIAVLFAAAIPSPEEYWAIVPALLFLLAALLASGMLVRSHRMLVQSLRDQARQAADGQHLRIEEARRLERERIAREMHDALGHRISLLALHAGALEYSPQVDPEALARTASTIRSCAYAAAEDLREVVGVLRGGDAAEAVRPQPTLPDLPELVDQSRRAGMTVQMEDRIADLDAVPAGIGRHAYRVVQEGLTNARKHAPGAPVRVLLAGGPGAGLTAEVGNAVPPGLPAEAVPGAGVGLVGLRERVDLAGGRLEHGRAGGDFVLRAWLPWPE
jgi:signal transduction histidine kinase